ncbi:cytochrome c oxidase subunit 3 [Marinobacteraceae bacterium S3BR75-40.1]
MATTTTSDRYLPGDIAVWIFIFAELAVFAILFIGFGVTRALQPELFHAGRALLHPWSGLASTFALISASYLVATSVERLRSGQAGTAGRLWLAIAVSGIYSVAKLWEWGDLYGRGYNLGTDVFFMFYFFLTFFHFMHVVLGQLVLGVLAVKVGSGEYRADNMNGMESGACYWHMVDLVWLVLFPLLYVVA